MINGERGAARRYAEQGRRRGPRARRRIAWIAGIVLLGVAAPAWANDARIISEQRIDTRVIELTVSTPAFTAPTKVDVDLPVGYESDGTQRWPVTYYLAGDTHHYSDFNTEYNGERLTQSFPSIVVSPNGNSGFWSDWYNAGAFGPPMYETYVIDQLIPLIDANFRTIASRAGRAVMGESMGGYGAMMFVAHHPDLFAAAASLSGAVDSNPPADGAAISASSSADGAPPNSIYGPRATQEVRWHGHNPVDLAANLRDVNLQVRTAEGNLDPAIGETLADAYSCLTESGIYQANIDLHDQLLAHQIPHLWKVYNGGCHSVPNFEREIADSLPGLAQALSHPQPPPASFNYISIQPHFDVWGWHVDVDPARALEFLTIRNASRAGLTLTGSGTTTITTPPLFRGLRRVEVTGGTPAVATPDASGRIRLTVDLGAPDRRQENTIGAATSTTSRAVTFAPHAVVRIVRTRLAAKGLRVCASATGGAIRARIRLLGPHRRPETPTVTPVLTTTTTCRTLRWLRPPGPGRYVLALTGHDASGHAISIRRTIRLPGRATSHRAHLRPRP